MSSEPYIKILNRREIRDLFNSSDVNPWHQHTPEGRFIGINEDGSWCAMDNAYGDCWTEDFDSLRESVDWLNRRLEKDYSLAV